MASRWRRAAKAEPEPELSWSQAYREMASTMLAHPTSHLLVHRWQLASTRAGFGRGALPQQHTAVLARMSLIPGPPNMRFLHGSAPSTLSTSECQSGRPKVSPIERYVAPGRPRQIVRSTFDPQKLTAADFVDVSGRFNHYIYFVDGKFSQLGMNYLQRDNKRYGFPKGSHGFFYYWTPPAPFPDIAGELRFRVTASEDPASFEAGHDLRVHLGSIWRVPLYSLVHAGFGVPIQAQLLRDGLVQQDTLEGWFTPTKRTSVNVDSNSLYFVGQHLELDLSKGKHWCNIISKRGTATFNLHELFQYKVQHHLIRPFKGLITARFERSTLPEHAGTRTFVLRVVEVSKSAQRLDPNYNDLPIPFPVAGELLVVTTRGRARSSPWAFDINSNKEVAHHAGLALLWDTEG